MPGTRPRSVTRQRRPFLIEGTLALIKQDGEEGLTLTAITQLRRDLTKRLERIEKKIDAVQASTLGAEEEPPAE